MEIIIRNAKPIEFRTVGELMVNVYSQLGGFPKPSEQPNYYEMLSNVGELTKQPLTELLIATNADGAIKGAVVYIGNMKHYGSGGSATKEKNAIGFRLLAVDTNTRGQGIGKLLVKECIRKAKEQRVDQIVIHSTTCMKVAWTMYERMGFVRSKDLDFMQGELPAFGFRLFLSYL